MGALQIVFTDNDQGFMQCSGGQSLTCVVCGGVPPYTWEATKGVLDKNTGFKVTLTPPSNPGSGVPGVAFNASINYVGCGHDSGTNHPCASGCAEYNCAGAFISCPAGGHGPNYNFVFGDTACQCADHSGHSVSGCSPFTQVQCTNVGGSDACQNAKDFGAINDKRTQDMKNQGCSPCVVSMLSAVVTVTDANGNSASRTVTVKP